MRCVLVRPIRAYVRYGPCSFGKQALYGHVSAHLWWLETDVDAETVFGKALRVYAGDVVGKYIYYFGIWEPNLTAWIGERLRTGDVFVDVGANIGYYSLLASTLVGDSGTVVAVEALPEIFSRLEDNLKKNGARNVRPVNAAVWHRDEKVEVFTRSEHPSGTTTLMPAWAREWKLQPHGEIQARPLPEILKPQEARAARLIKIDVEGAEWNVIAGMKTMLPACREDLEIIVEISRSMLETQNRSGQDVLDLFLELGFHAYRMENDYSAAAYLGRNGPIRPKRIQRIPEEATDQIDLVFSRIDAASL